MILTYLRVDLHVEHGVVSRRGHFSEAKSIPKKKKKKS